MKFPQLLTFVGTIFVAILGRSQGQNDLLFAVPTDQQDWDFCGYDYTDTCPPTVSIEQAACEAPLVVYGRVLQVVNGVTTEDTAVQIQVDYRSEFFDQDRKTIQKWGAGLENDVETSFFFNSSGFFTTWLTGFNNTPSDSGFGTTPCGTRSPRSQEELYFFLEGLPENEGKSVSVLENGVLSVNMSLSTSILQTGMAEGNNDVYGLVAQGAFNDDNRLGGNCRVVYCCYNPGCSECVSVLADAAGEFSCDSTSFSSNQGSSAVRNGIPIPAIAVVLFFGMISMVTASVSNLVY